MVNHLSATLRQVSANRIIANGVYWSLRKKSGGDEEGLYEKKTKIKGQLIRVLKANTDTNIFHSPKSLSFYTSKKKIKIYYEAFL